MIINKIANNCRAIVKLSAKAYQTLSEGLLNEYQTKVFTVATKAAALRDQWREQHSLTTFAV